MTKNITTKGHTGKPGPGTLQKPKNRDPSGTLQKPENRDPGGTLQKPGNWDPKKTGIIYKSISFKISKVNMKCKYFQTLEI